MKDFARRKLPHIYPTSSIFFLTFRLFDSLPLSKLKAFKDAFEKDKRAVEAKAYLQSRSLRSKISHRNFTRYEEQLDTLKYGSCILKYQKVAEILGDRIKKFDNQLYKLICYTIMPNHVHILFDTNVASKEISSEPKEAPVAKIMQMIKGGSTFEINKEMGAKGKVWASESFDRYIRNTKQYQNIYNYIIANPSKAGLGQEFSENPYQFENLDYGN